MTKTKAYIEMQKGNKICHENYTDEEYLFLNDNGEIETEDGYTHSRFGEFWNSIQKWESGWSVFIEKKKFIIKDTEIVYMTYEYEVEAESEKQAIEKYTNELAGSLECINEFVSDEETEGVIAEKL